VPGGRHTWKKSKARVQEKHKVGRQEPKVVPPGHTDIDDKMQKCSNVKDNLARQMAEGRTSKAPFRKKGAATLSREIEQ